MTGALVEDVIDAARAAVADPELRAALVPEAIAQVDERHLRLRLDVFRELPARQQHVLSMHVARAAEAPMHLRTPEREARIAGLRVSAERFTLDRAGIDALLAVADRIDDAGLDQLRTDLDKMVLAQRKDVEVLLDLGRRAGGRPSPI